MQWLSPIRVIDHTPTRLIILDPPYYLLGGIFLLAAVALTVWGVISRKSASSAADWRASLLAIPLGIVAIVQLTSTTRIAFSREAGTMVLERRYAGITVRHEEVPIDRIRSSGVSSNDGNHSLFIELSSGQTVALTGNSDRVGHNAAADAINTFLRGR
jgi:hypothetical protein